MYREELLNNQMEDATMKNMIKKEYLIPMTDSAPMTCATILCASEPQLGLKGNTSGNSIEYGD